MDLNPNQVWKLLSLSRLFGEEQLARIRARFDQEQAAGDVPDLWNWLVKTGALTSYQAELFSSGLNGPFRLDNYVIQDRLRSGPLKGTFLARHAGAQHPVQLDFFADGSTAAQSHWQAWCKRTEKLRQLDHPGLVRTYEAVTLPDHAFIVSEVPLGQPMEQKVPRKARLPWNQAAAIGAQIASALDALDKRQLVHGAVSPRTVWLGGKSQAQLRPVWQADSAYDQLPADSDECSWDYRAPEFLAGQPASLQGDLYSLGCLLIRLISGRPASSGSSIEEKQDLHRRGLVVDLSKYEVPGGLQQLLTHLLAGDPAQRPSSAADVARMLADFAGQPLSQLLLRAEPPASLASLLKSLSEPTPVVSGTRPDEPQAQVAVAPIEEPPPAKPAAPVPTLTLSELRAIRQAKRRRIFWATTSAVLLFAGFLGLLAWSLSRGKTVPVALAPSTPSGTVGEVRPDRAGPSPLEGELREGDPNAVTRQRLIPDDGLTLWESPTQGNPANLAYLPPGAKLVVIARPAELLADPDGQLMYQALDSELQQTIQSWSDAFVTPLAELESVVVGLYPTENQDYQAVSRVTFAKPVPRTELGERWGVDLLEEKAGSQLITRGTEAILLLPAGRAPPTGAEDGTAPPSAVVTAFLYGPAELVAAARDSANADNLSGPFASLNEVVDGRRHFNLLFQPAALFNDEGQWLMSGHWAPLNRYLRTLLDESARAGLLSLHFADGLYLELSLNHTVDKRPAELKRQLEERLRVSRNQAVQALATMNSNPYWERVRLRFDNMLNDLFHQLRAGVERQLVVVNCWLPPMAGHNLLAAADLALELGDASGLPLPLAAESQTPRTLEELLALPRSLAVTTNPDLNLLLQGIASEVNEQFPDLPFKFRIELAGTELAKEGITQNQRPGDFTSEQQPLSKILTEIMLRANPDKSAQSASDPNCKLVWVIIADPLNPSERLVQVTTRAAALEKALPLPPDFAAPAQQ